MALLAWRDTAAGRKLVGFWAFAVCRAPRSIIPLSVLAAPPFAHAYLAAPTVDRDALDETLQAMLERIAGDPSLPKIVVLEATRAESATSRRSIACWPRAAARPAVLGRSMRPMLASKLDGKQYMEKALSSSSRKKLRQHRRRLAEKGALESKVVTETGSDRQCDSKSFCAWRPPAGRAARGRLCSAMRPTRRFTREMVAALAPQGDAAIHAIMLDGRPVSMQIVLRAGTGRLHLEDGL